MIFETMDWDAEAKRIKAAFNLKGECEFIQDDLIASLISMGGRDGGAFIWRENICTIGLS